MADSTIHDIEETIVQIYSKNLNFFSTFHKDIYQKIIDFEKINKYNYKLTFENNHFDIKDEKNICTYNCDPYYDAQYRVKELTKANGFLLIKKDTLYNKKKYDDLEIDPYVMIDDYIKTIQDKEIKKNDKIIFLGSILGIHIYDILKNNDFKSALLIEDNIEIFRLSMFTTDYQDLSNNYNLIFCINEEEKEKKIKIFLDKLAEYNNKIKFEVASEEEVDLIEEISNILLQENELNYPFSEYLISYSRGINYLINKYKLLKLNKNYPILKDKPTLYLGGGLSLRENIQFIIDNKDKFFLVCVAAILKVLEEYKIIPDLIISSDSSKIIKKQFLVNETYYKNSIIFVSNKSHNELIEILPKANTFLFNDSLEVLSNTGTNTGFNVGNIGYSLLLKLGVTEVYLLGFDACVNKDTGESHSSKDLTIQYKEFNLEENEKISSETHLIKVPGSFEKTVYTTNHFNGMINSFKDQKGSNLINAFNLSNGAYLPGIKPLKINQVKLTAEKNKKSFNNTLLNTLNKISKNSISFKEKEFIKKEHLTIQKLKAFDEFNLFQSYKHLINNDKNKSTLFHIVNKYFKLLAPYYLYSIEIEENKTKKIFLSHHKKLISYLENNFYFKS